MTTILCVLRSGGDYHPAHVMRLLKQLNGRPLTCLTDLRTFYASGLTLEPLHHDWPGWWSKLEIFTRQGPCLYLDLDTNIIGDLDPMLVAAAKHDLIMCRDFWGVAHGVNSSVMAWSGDCSSMARSFAAHSEEIMRRYRTKQRWGDQAYIRDTWPGPITCWQDILPGSVASYKRGALMGEAVDRCATLVSHGHPRPWEPRGADAWLAKRGVLARRILAHA